MENHMKASPFAKRKKIKADPLASMVESDERYTPIGLINMKVTIPFIDQVYATRRLKQPFMLLHGKKLGVVIPFRNRHEHLHELLPRLEAALQKQGINYRIAISEQEDGGQFNPGKARNVGAELLSEFCDYYCFHDVDNIPVYANYQAANQPLRLVSRWTDTERTFDVFGDYTYFSGAITMLKEHFYQANGYPNDYWGWGHEDEVFHYRVLLNGLIPFQDNEGAFIDLANPTHEKGRSGSKPQKTNKRKMIRQMRWGFMLHSGIKNLRYKLIKEESLGEHVTKYTVKL
jgi:hypothetical protein